MLEIYTFKIQAKKITKIFNKKIFYRTKLEIKLFYKKL